MPGAPPTAQPTPVRPPPGVPHLPARVLRVLRAHGHRAHDPRIGRVRQAGLLPVGGCHDCEQRLAGRRALELHDDIPRAWRHQGRRAVKLRLPAHALGRVWQHGVGRGRAQREWPQAPRRARRGLLGASDPDVWAGGRK